MNVEQVRDYCIAKPGTTESFPFDNDTLVFKVMNKMFCLLRLEKFEQGKGSINLKCDPDEAIRLRDEYDGEVLPGYHMNKKLWNTVMVNGRLSDAQILGMIDDSYALIVASLTKKLQQELRDLQGP